MKAFNKLLQSIGSSVLVFCSSIGRIVIFALNSILHLFRPPFYGKEFIIQFMQIGFYSLPVVGLTALFTGAALALQIYSGGARFSAESVVPSIVAIGMVRELGPVLGGLMVAGRVSSSIAAELGTMRVTEQIDALEVMGINSLNHLVLPKVLATVFFYPFLIVLAMFLGIFGGWVAGFTSTMFSEIDYMQGLQLDFNPFLVQYALIKTLIFAFLIATVPSYH